MKKQILMPISLLIMVLIIIVLGSCGKLLEEDNQSVVTVGSTEDGGYTTSWNVQVIRSPETNICYEIITNDFSNSFDAISVDGKYCN